MDYKYSVLLIAVVAIVTVLLPYFWRKKKNSRIYSVSGKGFAICYYGNACSILLKERLLCNNALRNS